MEKTSYSLTIESPVFDTFRGNFNGLLRSTMFDMLKKDVKTAKITATVEISLEDSSAADDEIHEYHAERDIIVPNIKHKLTSQMNVKETAHGFVSGEGFELVINKETGAYELRALDAAQTSLFDDSFAREGFLPADAEENEEG